MNDVELYGEYYQGEKIGESPEEARAWCETHCRYCLAEIAPRDDDCEWRTSWGDADAPDCVYCYDFADPRAYDEHGQRFHHAPIVTAR